MSSPAVVTFDCYGTLIDWESGILAAVLPLLGGYGIEADSDRVLTAFARAESAVQRHVPFLSYAEVLRRTFAEMAKDLGFTPSVHDATVLLDTFDAWPAFPDTAAALRRLSSRWPLGVISNVDDGLLEQTLSVFDVEFSVLVTAEQVGAYKPALAMFMEAHTRLHAWTGPSRARWLHAAQSRFHDVAPASSLGISTALVRRPSGRSGSAVPESSAEATVAVDDLHALERWLDREGRA